MFWETLRVMPLGNFRGVQLWDSCGGVDGMSSGDPLNVQTYHVLFIGVKLEFLFSAGTIVKPNYNKMREKHAECSWK